MQSSEDDKKISGLSEIESVDNIVQKYLDHEFTAGEALPILLSLLDKGKYEASGVIALLYETGKEGVERDLNKAIWYYQHSVEHIGNEEDYLALGRLYSVDSYGKKDPEASMLWYQSACDLFDSAIGHIQLGKCYLDGEGVNRDIKLAETHFRKAISKGFVGGYKGMVELSKHTGHRFRSIYYRTRIFFRTLYLLLTDKSDERLREN